MKVTVLFISMFFILPFIQIHAQESVNRCATTEYMNLLKEQDPDLNAKLLQMESRLQQFLSFNNQGTSNSVIVIPVVVHVIWHTTSQNISDAMVESQIDVLNEDYRRMNSDTVNTPPIFQGVAGDSRIEFRLATVDPDGNPTDGITRTFTDVTSFPFGNSMKFTSTGGHDAWDATSYLNVWVCNLSGGLLGFAQFPGGSTATDGVVILYSAFGYQSPAFPYNLGRTTTHEVGHWLNLYHIWGDDGGSCSGSDLVNDTPNQGNYYFGCPSNPFSCSSDDMVENYMDYTDDACMNIFTMGQDDRMTSAYTLFRSNLMVSVKETLDITSTGVDYTFTDWNGDPFATLNFDNLGTVTSVEVEVFPDYYPPDQPEGTKAVKRYFDITADGTGFSATLTVNYDDSEVIDFDNGDSNLMLFRYDGSAWILMGGTVDPAANTVTLADVSDFSSWTLADPNDNPIPVELTAFSSAVVDNNVQLSWSTATETNNNGFEIQRSLVNKDEDLSWFSVGFVRSHGNSTEVNHYSFTDGKLEPGNYNYRLKIIDYDGSYDYSNIVNGLISVPNEYALMQNYPNPFNPSTKIEYRLVKPGFVTLKLFNALGKEVKTLVNRQKEAGAHEVNLDAQNLPSGVYFYTLTAGEFHQTKKMVLLR